MRYAMAIDLRTCVGCAACVVACKVENRVDDDSFRCRIEQRTYGQFPHLKLDIFSERCNQCTDAPCVTNCPTGASHYEDGGIVMVDEKLCTGCKACITSCPYDARFINSRGVAEKCTFCLHRVKQGMEPACVATCPSKAMVFGDLDDASSPVRQALATRKYRTLKPEAGTKPNVFYLE